MIPNWLTDELDLEAFEPPVLVIDRQMNPPWLADGDSIGWAGERERLRLMRG